MTPIRQTRIGRPFAQQNTNRLIASVFVILLTMSRSSLSRNKQSAQPRGVILKLLLAAEGAALSTREALAGCALLGISDNHARVALVRLSSAGMIAAVGRGAYQLGPEAAGLAAEVLKWRAGEERVRRWNGDWLAVHTANLGRRDRGAVRSRDRALALLGLRELDYGLYVRPDNLRSSIDDSRQRLLSLGLEAEAVVFVAKQFDDERERKARQLWHGKNLNRAYEQTRQQLETWMARADQLDPDQAARESYLLGDKAIRQLVFDPLLPSPLVDTAARAAFTATVLRFDRLGHAIWRNLALRAQTGSGTRAAARATH